MYFSILKTLSTDIRLDCTVKIMYVLPGIDLLIQAQFHETQDLWVFNHLHQPWAVLEKSRAKVDSQPNIFRSLGLFPKKEL